MEREEAIEKILDGQAVLFAGSGFSYGATNNEGKVPSAQRLKEILLEDLGMDKKADYSLEAVGDYYKRKKSPNELIDKLREQFNIQDIAEHHNIIMGMQWKRVYTTNYDQTIERASQKSGIIRDPIILTDDFNASGKKSICVHINGYIERVNAEKLDRDFKLTDRSYSCETLVGNPWFEFMANDFDAASAIVVIGYSMKFDVDIKRLFSPPEISKKVILIDAPDIDELSKDTLANYGNCYPIGIQKFAEEIEEAKKDYVPSVNFSYKSFKYMYHDTLTSMEPTYDDIVKFYIKGKRSESLFLKNNAGEYDYLLRRKAMNCFLRDYRTAKVFIALSNLGNGKSVFLDMVENELRKEDVKVYTYLHRYDLIDEEIESICNETKKCVVIMDNYPGHMDILEKFYQYGHTNITFLLSARNGVNLMFCKQLEQRLRITAEDVRLLYLNQLEPDEIENLAYLMENNALLKEGKDDEAINTDLIQFIKDDCKGKLSNLLLKLFEESSIKDKLVKLYNDLVTNEKETVKKVVIFSLLKNTSNYDLNFREILDLFRADYIALRKNDIEFMSEIFEQGEDYNSITVRSSIISTALLRDVIDIADIINTMKEAFLAADKKESITYKELQKSMVSHSQFVFLTKDNTRKEAQKLIEGFYDGIRNTKFAKNNSFFWEQFASVYIDTKNFDLVKKCIDTALCEAKKKTGFVPFQIKTVQGRFFVEKSKYDLIKGRGNASEAVDAIANATDAILLHYNDPRNNLYYVFKVVRFFPEIFEYIKDSMNNREVSIYIEKCSIMKKRMTDYLDKNKESQYYGKVKAWNSDLEKSIEEAKQII